MNYADWLLAAQQRLAANFATDPYLNPKIDSHLLLQAVTQRSKAALFAFSETQLSEQEQCQLESLLQRREAGEPMAYILGEKEFWSLPLNVSPHTLIPRPDTERLVELALEEAGKRLDQGENLRILDLGTGTGAIALALASELGERAEIIGVDRVAEAVQLAEQNRQRLQLAGVHFLQSDWFSQLTGQKFEIIVSNPPYIEVDDPHLTLGDVRFEPLSALVAAENGLSDLQKIIANAPLALNPNGVLLLEHGWQQAQAVRSLFQNAGWAEIETRQDYAGQDRVSKAKWIK